MLKEALTLLTTCDSTNVSLMQGHLRQSWISFNPSGLMEILLSPHDCRLRGLVNSSWIAIDRKSQQAESLRVRHKTQEIDCTCGELIDTYEHLTPVRGIVHTNTGSDPSDKDVQYIMERLTTKCSL